jgi:hypothetical protein
MGVHLAEVAGGRRAPPRCSKSHRSESGAPEVGASGTHAARRRTAVVADQGPPVVGASSSQGAGVPAKLQNNRGRVPGRKE